MPDLADATDLAFSPRRLARTLTRRVRSGAAPAAPNPFASVSRRETALLLYRLARSQRPGHSPQGERTPPFADEWFAAYNRGHDVVHWYDTETRTPAPPASAQGAP